MEDGKKGEDAVRSDLIPILVRAEHDDPEIRSFFLRYQRVLVFDDATNPDFRASRITAYLKIEKQANVREPAGHGLQSAGALR